MKVSRIENTISSMSFTTAYHHWKLITRTVFLVMVIVNDFICRAHHVDYFSMEGLHTSFFAMAIWVLFMMEMVLRLLPSKLESKGCQKQFQSMYKPGQGRPVAGTAKSGRKITALVWILINLPFALLYYLGIFSQSELMILAMVYSVCDMICILYFCPFQTWIMKNRCCTNCYIYNWDYAMMYVHTSDTRADVVQLEPDRHGPVCGAGLGVQVLAFPGAFLRRDQPQPVMCQLYRKTLQVKKAASGLHRQA